MARPGFFRQHILHVILLCACIARRATAHEHEVDNIPAGEVVSPDPLDTVLWIHIICQTVTWGLIFPTGMVLGIIRSRWHVPVQILGTALAILGYFMGHAHGGRQFSYTAHAGFAPFLNLLLFVQVCVGIYLRMHLDRGMLGRIRPTITFIHGIIGKAMPIAAWVQMLFGGIAVMGFCTGDHLGQCAAHFIMGSAFIAYGIILTILLLVGQYWLRRTGRSQEFFDSAVIAAWGCVNTWTEHRWGTAWVKNDLQHTSMGIVWWCAGLVGMWLSRTRGGRPKRNIIPGIVIFLTGYAMSAHPQELMLSTMIHTFFGYSLMAAGATRIIEISFILRDRSSVSMDGSDPHSFQFLPIFLLYASGFLFMGATEEQMAFLAGSNVTHVSYILILYSIAFMLFLFVNVLLHIYAVHSLPPEAMSRKERKHHRRRRSGSPISADSRVHSRQSSVRFAPYTEDEDNADLEANGRTVDPGVNLKEMHKSNGVLSDEERQRLRGAEEFELDALISDGEEYAAIRRSKEQIS